jgi:hypothetical protein
MNTTPENNEGIDKQRSMNWRKGKVWQKFCARQIETKKLKLHATKKALSRGLFNFI